MKSNNLSDSYGRMEQKIAHLGLAQVLVRKMIVAQIRRLRESVGVLEAPRELRSLWLSFEEANTERTVLKVLLHLEKRNAKIDDFFFAFSNASDTEVATVLAAMDSNLGFLSHLS